MIYWDPIFLKGSPLRTVIAHPDEPGERLFISGRILQNDCESSISGAMLEVWHPNDAGCYSISGGLFYRQSCK